MDGSQLTNNMAEVRQHILFFSCPLDFRVAVGIVKVINSLLEIRMKKLK